MALIRTVRTVTADLRRHRRRCIATLVKGTAMRFIATAMIPSAEIAGALRSFSACGRIWIMRLPVLFRSPAIARDWPEPKCSWTSCS